MSDKLFRTIQEDIEHRFSLHSCNADQVERMTKIREGAKQYALLIAELTPVSREQSLALTHLEDVVYSANSAIARNE